MRKIWLEKAKEKVEDPMEVRGQQEAMETLRRQVVLVIQNVQVQEMKIEEEYSIPEVEVEAKDFR